MNPSHPSRRLAHPTLRPMVSCLEFSESPLIRDVAMQLACHSAAQPAPHMCGSAGNVSCC
jgi:hypothetical protein